MLKKELSGNQFLKYAFSLILLFILLNIPLVLLGIPHPMIPGFSNILASFFADPSDKSMNNLGQFVSIYSIILLIIGVIELYFLYILVRNRYNEIHARYWVKIVMFFAVLFLIIGYFGKLNFAIWVVSMIVFVASIFYLSKNMRN